MTTGASRASVVRPKSSRTAERRFMCIVHDSKESHQGVARDQGESAAQPVRQTVLPLASLRVG